LVERRCLVHALSLHALLHVHVHQLPRGDTVWVSVGDDIFNVETALLQSQPTSALAALCTLQPPPVLPNAHLFQRVLERLEAGRPGDAMQCTEHLQLLDFEFQRCGLTVPEVPRRRPAYPTRTWCLCVQAPSGRRQFMVPSARASFLLAHAHTHARHV
jgi:hypothetical protein